MSKEYFTSERFIHDDLAQAAAVIAVKAREEWKRNRAIRPYAITWPSESLKTDDGAHVDGAFICALPEEAPPAARLAVLQKMVEKTKAYGLVLIEQVDDYLRVLFETHHGARAWLMRLERHGDVVVCMAPEVRDDAECVGILWRRGRGAS